PRRSAHRPGAKANTSPRSRATRSRFSSRSPRRSTASSDDWAGALPGARSAFGGQVVVARPLVPRARVVAGVVAGRAERQRADRRARAGVAVRHDLRALGQARQLADPPRFVRASGAREEPLDLE